MTDASVLFIDVQNTAYHDLARRFLDAGLGVIANGPFAGGLAEVESWESFEPSHAAQVVSQDLACFVEGLTKHIRTSQGLLPFRHRGAHF